MKYRYRNEDELKDSGIEWIGRIPKEWSVKKLKYLAKIDTGNKDTQDKEEKGLYPFFVRSDTVERSNTYSFDGEAILTAGDGVGVAKVFHYIKGKFEYHQRVYKISDFNDINGRFLYYYIKSNFGKEVEKISAKTTVDSLRLPMFLNFPVVVNDEFGEKIAKFLDEKTSQFDTIIAKKEKLIEKLEEAKKSLISEVVTGKVKVVKTQAGYKLEERKKEEMKDSGVEWLGDVPIHWTVTKIKYYVDIFNGKEIEDEESNIEKNIDVYGSGGVFKYTSKVLSDKESVLFGRKGTIGKPLYVSGEFWTVDTMYYTSFKNGVLGKLIYYILLDYPWDLITTKTALPSVVGKDVGNSKWCIPDLNEQKIIVEYLNLQIKLIDTMILKLKKQINILKEAKQSLISEAVTGKIEILD